MGIQKIANMAVQFKGDWVISSFVPKIIECYNVEKQGFNYRMACLQSLAAVMPSLKKDEISECLVPTFVKACTDKVPNVQFAVARILK